MRLIVCLLVWSICSGVMTNSTHAAINVSVELSLLVDVSGSVSGDEFILQRDGYANAFRTSSVQNAILASQDGIAVNFVYWSSSTQQSVSVTWTHIRTTEEANAFADAVQQTTRPFSGGTSISGAINFATPSFTSNNFSSSRFVMDISGDGSEGSSSLATARSNALAAGITINGLAIGGAGIFNFYRDFVIGGPGAFIESASNFTDFEGAVIRKLTREITSAPSPPQAITAATPLPPTILAMGMGLVLVGFKRLRTTGTI